MSNTEKAKKISISAFDKIMKATYEPTTTISWNGSDILITKTLSFSSMIEFVTNVTEACFSDSGEYLPEAKDFMIKNYILEKYTNISLPSNIEHKYSLIYCTDIIKVVTEHVNNEQLREIVDAITDKVDTKAQADIESINKQVTELCASFSNMSQQFENTFADVKAEDLSKMIGAISDGKFDEAKLVEAYKNMNTQDE